MNDKEFLTWIHERLEHRYEEDRNQDYMVRLRQIIDGIPLQREEELVSALRETYRHIEAMYAKQRMDSPEIQRSADRALELTVEIIRRSNDALRHGEAVASNGVVGGKVEP